GRAARRPKGRSVPSTAGGTGRSRRISRLIHEFGEAVLLESRLEPVFGSPGRLKPGLQQDSINGLLDERPTVPSRGGGTPRRDPRDRRSRLRSPSKNRRPGSWPSRRRSARGPSRLRSTRTSRGRTAGRGKARTHASPSHHPRPSVRYSAGTGTRRTPDGRTGSERKGPAAAG